MFSTDADKKGAILPLIGLCAMLAACTAREVRTPLPENPVAAPTTTVKEGGSAGGPRSDGESDVPFDGGRPEALGTAFPEQNGSVNTGTSVEQNSAAAFDVYAELLKGTLQCTEALK